MLSQYDLEEEPCYHRTVCNEGSAIIVRSATQSLLSIINEGSATQKLLSLYSLRHRDMKLSGSDVTALAY